MRMGDRLTTWCLSAGRKRIGKLADLVLVALYKLVAWKSAAGNQCYVLAKDEDQAGDIVGS